MASFDGDAATHAVTRKAPPAQLANMQNATAQSLPTNQVETPIMPITTPDGDDHTHDVTTYKCLGSETFITIDVS